MATPLALPLCVGLFLSACSPDTAEPASGENSAGPLAQQSVSNETAPTADAASSAEPALINGIPETMLGVWGDELSCQGLSDGRLEITPQRVEFHESVGEIQVASTQGEWTEFALAMSGEGETWESTERFRVTDEGIERETGGTVRPRCAEEYQ